MSSMIKATGIMVVCVGMLAACNTQGPAPEVTKPNITEPEVEAVEAVVETAEPSLFFSWALSQSTLIAPPVEIQNEAIKNCRTLGFDTSYMINIGIDGDDAVAEFGCRGADQ